MVCKTLLISRRVLIAELNFPSSSSTLHIFFIILIDFLRLADRNCASLQCRHLRILFFILLCGLITKFLHFWADMLTLCWKSVLNECNRIIIIICSTKAHWCYQCNAYLSLLKYSRPFSNLVYSKYLKKLVKFILHTNINIISIQTFLHKQIKGYNIRKQPASEQ